MGAVCGSNIAEKRRVLLEELAESEREKDQDSETKGEPSFDTDGHQFPNNSSSNSNLENTVLGGTGTTSVEIIHKSSNRASLITSDALIKGFLKSRSPRRKASRHVNLSCDLPIRHIQKLSSNSHHGKFEDWLSNYDDEGENTSNCMIPNWSPPPKKFRRISSECSVISVSDKIDPDDGSSDTDSYSITKVKVAVPGNPAPEHHSDRYVIDLEGTNRHSHRNLGSIVAMKLEADKPESCRLQRDGCCRDVAKWLRNLGADESWRRYAKVFENNKIDAISLYSLNFEDLRNLGVLEFHAIAILSNLRTSNKYQRCRKCQNSHNTAIVEMLCQGDESHRSASRLKQQMQNQLEKENEKLKIRTRELESEVSGKELENGRLEDKLGELRQEIESLTDQVAQLNMECHNHTQYIYGLQDDLNQCVNEVGALEIQLEEALTDRKLLWEDLQVEKQITYERRVENSKLRSLLATRNSLAPYYKPPYTTEESPSKCYSTSSDSSGDDFDMNIIPKAERGYNAVLESRIEITKGKTVARVVKYSKDDSKSNDVHIDLTLSAPNVSEFAPPDNCSEITGGEFSADPHIFNPISMQVAENLKSLTDNDEVSHEIIISGPEVNALGRQTFTSSVSPREEPRSVNWAELERIKLSNDSNTSNVSSSESFELGPAEDLARPLLLSQEILSSLTERDIDISQRESPAKTQRCSSALEETEEKLTTPPIISPSAPPDVEIIKDSQPYTSTPRHWKDFVGSSGNLFPRGTLVERTSAAKLGDSSKTQQNVSESTMQSQETKDLLEVSPRGSLISEDTCKGKEELTIVRKIINRERNSHSPDQNKEGSNTTDLVRDSLMAVSNKGRIEWEDFSSILSQHFPFNETLLRSVFHECSIDQEFFLQTFLEKLSSDYSDLFVQFRDALSDVEIVKSMDVIFDNASWSAPKDEVNTPSRCSNSPESEKSMHVLASSFPLTDICEDEISSDDEAVNSSPRKGSTTSSYRFDLKTLSSSSWELSEEADGMNKDGI